MCSTAVPSVSTYSTPLLTERCGEVYCSLTYENFFINCLKCSKEFDLLSCSVFIKHISKCLRAAVHDLAQENPEGKEEHNSSKELATKISVENTDYGCHSLDPLLTIKEENVKEKEEVNDDEICEDVECMSDYQNEDDLPLDKLARRKIVQGIINEYRKHPVLWDAEMTAKRPEKVRAYRKIRKAVNLKFKANFSYIELRNQIQNLKSEYRRVLRRKKVYGGLFPDGEKKFNPVPWFFDKMFFLEATNQDTSVDLTLNSETDGEGNESSDSSSDSVARESRKPSRTRPSTKMLNEREIVSNIISQYKQYPFLWDQTSPLYSDRHARKDAFRKITKFINQKFEKSVTDKELRQQIINLRGVYRRVQREMHKPNYRIQLWYYDELSFIDNKANFEEIVNGECTEFVKQEEDINRIEENGNQSSDNEFLKQETTNECEDDDKSNAAEDHDESSNPLSCRKRNNKVVLSLIDEYKKHPSLWSKNHSKVIGGHKRYDALKEIVTAVNAKHKTNFTKAEIRNKLVQMRSSYRRVLRNKEAFEKKHANAKRKFFPNLWYFDKMMFIGARDCDFSISRKRKTKSTCEEDGNENRVEEVSEEQTNSRSTESALHNLEDQNRPLLRAVIEEYKKRPRLWEGKCNTATRRKYLNEICDVVNQRLNAQLNYRILERKMNDLISLYKRTSLKEGSGESGNCKSKLWFGELLSFINIQDSQPNRRHKLEDQVDCSRTKSERVEHSSSGDEEAYQNASPVNNKEIVFRIIELFKDAAILWDTNHPLYTLRTERKKSIEAILAKLNQEHDCHLTVEEFRYQIRFLKNAYFRALRQETTVKQANLSTDYACMPFFFEEMSFLEPYADKKPKPVPDVQVTTKDLAEDFTFLCENKPLMLNFIELYKAHGCLWDQSHKDRTRPSAHNAAYNEIINMFKENGEIFTEQRLKSAIGFLHDTVVNTQTLETAKDHSVWFSEHLQFLGTVPRIKEKFCAHCNQHFHSLTEYEKHKIEIAGDYPYKCEVCSAGFVCRSKFAYHQITHKEPHKCDQCDFQAFDKHNFNVHMRRHKGIHLFRCDECGKGFVTSSELNRHVRMHTGEKAYICEICGKALVANAEYHQHMKRHRNQRDHKCEVCDSAFFTAKALKGHMASHSSERQHVCDICGSAFKRKKTLCQHMALHMDKKKHECKICGKMFAQKAGVYSHMKSHGQVIGS